MGLILSYDLPIYFGWVIVDARDPENPGGVKAIVVTPLQFWLECALAVGCLVLFIWLWRSRRRLTH